MIHFVNVPSYILQSKEDDMWLWLLWFWFLWTPSGHWDLAPFFQGIKTETGFKHSVIPAGITEEAKKIQKACLQI